MGGNKKGRDRLFSVVPSEGTGDDWHKFKSMKFYQNTRKHFHFEGGQTAEQVAQRGCGVSILGDSQEPCGRVSGQLALGGPA